MQPPLSAEAVDAAAAAASTPPGELVAAAVQQFVDLCEGNCPPPSLERLRSFLEQSLQFQDACKQRQEQRQQQQQGGGNRVAVAAAPIPPPPLTLEPIAGKEQRTAVHRLFKSLMGFPRMATTTVVQQQQEQQSDAAEAGSAGAAATGPSGLLQCIQVEVVSSSGGGGGGGGGRGEGRGGRGEGRGGQGGRGGQKRKRRDDSDWPGGAQRYSSFVLYKENQDAQQALATLAQMLRLHHKVFAVAGTKDKRGVTVQMVRAWVQGVDQGLCSFGVAPGCFLLFTPIPAHMPPSPPHSHTPPSPLTPCRSPRSRWTRPAWLR